MAHADVKKVVIIGSGPAGWTAAIYAARAQLHPIVYCGVPKQPRSRTTLASSMASKART